MQEFKLATVRRLEQGVEITARQSRNQTEPGKFVQAANILAFSSTELARGLEVNPNVLHGLHRESAECIFSRGPSPKSRSGREVTTG